MAKMSIYFFYAGGISMLAAAGFYLWYVITQDHTPGTFARLMSGVALFCLSGSLITRFMASGHGPFANQFEFSVSFAWGIVASHTYMERRYKLRFLGLATMPIGLALLYYASTIPKEIEPLVPALQNNLLLTLHVAAAIVAYGMFAVAFGVAILYLINHEDRISWLPSQVVLDDIGYRAVILGFPLMAAVIILGAIWADVAWGRYWSWDPKETASLITWVLYAAYLHARSLRGWRGTRSAVLLLVGFGATLFTFFGNLFFRGLHAYA